MNTVRPQVRNSQNLFKEETKSIHVVHVICFLCLFIQVYHIFFDDNEKTLQEQQLVKVMRGVTLTLKDGGPSTSIPNAVADSIEFNSPEGYHLTPFFFKQIPINYCDEQLLMSIRGVGPSLAKSILTYRDNNGGFQKTEDLLAVKGIGETRLGKIAPLLSF